jgi:hypothetical protein
MADKNGGVLKWMAEYDRRYVYLVLFLVVTIPLLRPIGMAVSVSPDTQQYYDVLNTVKAGDKVFFTLNTEYSGFNEIHSGIVASLRVLVEHKAKICFAEGHVEATIIPDIIIKEVKSEMDANDYQYGRDYVILGYVMPNEPAVASMASDFHAIVTQDFLGRSIQGTFLDDVHTWQDWDLIDDFSTGLSTTYLQNHFALRGTTMIVNCIGVSVPSEKPYLNSGLIKGLLQSMKGGAELEYLIGPPGVGLTSMDAFTFGHYMLIVFIIIGNIGYLGYVRKTQTEVKGG